MIEKDEDIEYGKWRQRQLDEQIAKDKAEYDIDQYRPLPTNKQPQFAKHECQQKFATRDPWPNVPWREDESEVPTLWGALIVLLIVVCGFMVGLLLDVL